MKNQLTTIASLPGSGSGCQSALPAEVGKERAPAAVVVTTMYDIAEQMVLTQLHALLRRTPPEIRRYGKPCKATGFVEGGFIGTDDDWKKHFPGEAVIPLPRRPADLLDAAGGGE